MPEQKSPDFESLKHLKNILSSIRRNHASTMEHYRSDDGRGFFHQPQHKKASRSSTATCVTSLVRSGLWTPNSSWWGATSKIAKKLIAKPWKSAGLKADNPFTVSFIVEGILDLKEARSNYAGAQEHLRRIRQEAVPLLKSCFQDGAIHIHPYPPSAYLTQLTFRVLNRQNAIGAKLKAKIHRWSRSEINKQISLISAKSRVGDPLNLGYALILATSTVQEEQTSPEDKQIFSHALDLFFESQRDDGSWPYSRPLFHYPDVGNAYCFEYELLTQMLLCKPLHADLLRYIPKIALTTSLLQSTSFDLNSEKPGTMVAWPSGHHPQLQGPESWSTASVYDFAHALNGLVAEAIRRALFEELGAVYSPPIPSKNPDAGDRFAPAPNFVDANLILEDKRVLSLRKTIAEKFVFPIAREAHRVGRGESLSSATPMSAIFFGPPGTSKTQLASHIAAYLGWPLLSVDPSYLVQDGLDRIQAQANRLFNMLTVSEQVVVLLDEFDEMGRDRSRSRELLSRFITTAMLPKLASINRERKSVFLLATNYISSFDAAFSRGGRFDMRIQVMVPNLNAKFRRWPMLKNSYAKLSARQKNEVKPSLSDLTYLECEQLVRKLKNTSTVQEIRDAISEASILATLNQPNEIDHRSDSDNGNAVPAQEQHMWKETCKSERKQIRLPS